jgi:hypothetical protein
MKVNSVKNQFPDCKKSDLYRMQRSTSKLTLRLERTIYKCATTVSDYLLGVATVKFRLAY